VSCDVDDASCTTTSSRTESGCSATPTTYFTAGGTSECLTQTVTRVKYYVDYFTDGDGSTIATKTYSSDSSEVIGCTVTGATTTTTSVEGFDPAPWWEGSIENWSSMTYNAAAQSSIASSVQSALIASGLLKATGAYVTSLPTYTGTNTLNLATVSPSTALSTLQAPTSQAPGAPSNPISIPTRTQTFSGVATNQPSYAACFSSANSSLKPFTINDVLNGALEFCGSFKNIQPYVGNSAPNPLYYSFERGSYNVIFEANWALDQTGCGPDTFGYYFVDDDGDPTDVCEQFWNGPWYCNGLTSTLTSSTSYGGTYVWKTPEGEGCLQLTVYAIASS